MAMCRLAMFLRFLKGDVLQRELMSLLSTANTIGVQKCFWAFLGGFKAFC